MCLLQAINVLLKLIYAQRPRWVTMALNFTTECLYFG